MTEHRRDRFEAHPAVDGLGGERVPQLVGMDVPEPGGAPDTPHDPPDVVAVEASAVVVQEIAACRWMCGGPVGEEPLRVRVERDVSVVVEFADRDP